MPLAVQTRLAQPAQSHSALSACTFRETAPSTHVLNERSRHRHPELHQCLSVSTPASAATATDKKPPIPVYIPKKFKKPPTDPAKLAQWRKLEVMKMRHKASPGDPKDKNSSLPPDQRLHVKLFVGDTENIFWFRRVRHKKPMKGSHLIYLPGHEYGKGFGPSCRAIETEVSRKSGV